MIKIKARLREWRRYRPLTITALILLSSSLGLLPDRTNLAAATETHLVKGLPGAMRPITLAGHLHPPAQSRFDRGAVPSTLEMLELKLVLRRSAAQEAALETLLASQQNPTSRNYRMWLTPEQFGTQFGVDDQALLTVKTWLESHSFKVGDVSAGRNVLPFTGTAAQVEAAFQTPIHYFALDGVRHFANTQNPQIPAAFQNLVSGIRGLHDFRARSNVRSRKIATPDYLAGGANYVGPVDYSAIYNMGPLFFNGVRGDNVSIAVAAQSDIDPSIPAKYWAAFGVTQKQQLSSVAATASTDPGRTDDGNESEAYMDVEIIGAMAPDAKIVLVRDKSVITAFEYAIDHNLAAVLNVSFSTCERTLGSANASVNSAYQQAVAEGITVVVSAGDNGIDECEDATRDTVGDAVVSGLSVNGLASTPYDVAVGGTDFNPLFVNQGSYWNTSNSTGVWSNAKSYIPEMVWNTSCANPVTAQMDGVDNPLALCNNSDYASLVRIAGGGGGLSSCMSVTSSGVCNGAIPRQLGRAASSVLKV